MVAVAVCRHYSGEVYSVIVVAAVAGVRVADGVEADSAAVDLVEAVASEEVSVAVVILAEVAPVAVGSGTNSATINSTPNNYG